MKASRFIVWVRDRGQWAPNGDGPMTLREAERIAKEVRRECGVRTRVLPVGAELE